MISFKESVFATISLMRSLTKLVTKCKEESFAVALLLSSSCLIVSLLHLLCDYVILILMHRHHIQWLLTANEMKINHIFDRFGLLAYNHVIALEIGGKLHLNVTVHCYCAEMFKFSAAFIKFL